MVLSRACSHRDSRAAFVGPSEAASLVGTPRPTGLVFPAAQGTGSATARPPARRVFAPLRGLGKRPFTQTQRRVCRGNGPPSTSTSARTAKNQFSVASFSRDVGCGRRVVGPCPGPFSPREGAGGGGGGRSGRAVLAITERALGYRDERKGGSYHSPAGVLGLRMHGRSERR